MILRRGIHLGFAFVFGALVMIGFYSSQAIRVLYGDSKRMSTNRELSRSLRTLLVNLTDAETGQRGYLLTGNQEYLEPYWRGQQEIPKNMAHVRTLVAGQPQRETQLARLATLSELKLTELKATIEIYRQQGMEPARASVMTNQGKAVMDEFRQIIKSVDEEAETGVRIWETALESSRVRLARGLVFLLGIGLILLLTVYLVTLRYLRQQEKSQTVLESRVAERTGQLAEANAALQSEVAERQRTAEMLRKFNLELTRSNRELEDFAYVASHDLQEPLRKIQAFGTRLKTRHAPALNAEAQDYLARMQNAAQRMETLIRDLLTYSRITTQGKPFKPTNLNEIIGGVLDDLEELLRMTAGTVTYDALPTVTADPLQMRQLLQNLLANALKFHRPGVAPRIVVNSRLLAADAAQPERIELTVADNGIGFEEKYLDKIFQPFQRLHARQAYEGTGMGLAVCRKIIERHNGTITARSTPDVGTTFIAVLPVTPAPGEINHATATP